MGNIVNMPVKLHGEWAYRLYRLVFTKKPHFYRKCHKRIPKQTDAWTYSSEHYFCLKCFPQFEMDMKLQYLDRMK